MAEHKWIQGAIKHPGKFTEYAHRHGFETVAAAIPYAEKHGNATVKKEATLARTLGKMNKK